MKYLVPLGLLITGFIAHAQNIEREKSAPVAFSSAGSFELVTKNGAVNLIAKTCKELQSELTSFQALYQKLESKTLPSAPPCNCNEDYCSVDLKNILPAKIAEYQGKDSSCDSSNPNCWNLVLFTEGILPFIRYSDDSEFSFFLNSPLCKKKNSIAEAVPGDVMAIRNGKQEVHGFVYVSSNYCWSKNGFDQSTKFEVQSTADVLFRYGVNPELLTNPNAKSNNSIDVYACVSFSEYQKLHPKEFAKRYKRMEKSLLAMECTMQEQMTSPHKDLQVLRDTHQKLIEFQNKKRKKNIWIGSLMIRAFSAAQD